MAVALFIKAEDLKRNTILDGNIDQFIEEGIKNKKKNEKNNF